MERDRWNLRTGDAPPTDQRRLAGAPRPGHDRSGVGARGRLRRRPPDRADSGRPAVGRGTDGSACLLRLPVNAAPSATVSSQLRVTPTGLEFGKVQVGETSPPQSVILTNIGSTDFDLSVAGGGRARSAG